MLTVREGIPIFAKPDAAATLFIFPRGAVLFPSARPVSNQTRRNLAYAALVTSLLTWGACSSGNSLTRALPPPGVPVRSAPSVSERDRLLNEAMSQVLLAREQLRLGLADEAEAAWNRAVDILAPLAVVDSEITGRLRAIVAERDRALSEVEGRSDAAAQADAEAGDAGEDAGEGDDELAGEQPERIERIVILQAPEPELDPTHIEEVTEAAQEVTTPDYPVETSPRVLAWLEAWTGNLRAFFGGSIERSGLHADRLREIFAQEGLPKDLVYLAHVESGFKTSAYSRAAARGIFQFIPETGRRYGLRIDRFVDERADPEKSARASAAYLRDLYEEFQDWKLALAAYNCGEGKIRRTINSTGLRDFWDPRFQRYLRQETRNYVPAIFAATLIAKQPEKFGFTDVKPFAPLGYETVAVPQATPLASLAKLLGTEAETLQALNPELRRGYTPPTATYTLKVPVGSGSDFAEKYASLTPADKQIQFDVYHKVVRGDTLASIAKRYGVSSSALKRTNRLRRNSVRVGQSLRIPDDGAAQAKAVSPKGGTRTASSSSHAKTSPTPPQKATYYRVRRGDTLTEIAAKFDVEIDELQRWNTMGSRTRVAIGERLRVAAPAGSGSSPTVREAAETPPPAPKDKLHTVRVGETLWRIAQNYGVSIDALLGANGLKKSSIIKPGMQLRIPGGRGEQSSGRSETAPVSQVVHVVQRGETLASIAERYRTSVASLCKLNGLNANATIFPGDTLTVTR